MRESLSAAYDGEHAPLDAAAVRAHVAGCPGCAAFEASLHRSPLVTTPAPDLSNRILARLRRRRPLRLLLRLAVAVAALTELGFALDELFADAEHEAHETSSFTIALCVGLLIAAVRPRLAGPYVPIVAIASAMLVATACADVDEHRVPMLHETPHLALVMASALLAMLAWEESGPPPSLRRLRLRARPRPSPRLPLHVVPRSLRAVAALTITLGLVFVAGPAQAHAVLEGSDPGQGAVVSTLPATVTLRFDESVTLLPTSVQVFGPDGSRVDRGTATHPGGSGPKASIGVSSQQHGTYLVSWRVISADSHPVSGAFTFSVGTTSAAPVAPVSHPSRTISWSLGVARWLGYAGSALLVGVLLVLAWCWPEGRASRASRMLWAGVGVLALGALLELVLKGPYDASLGVSAIGRGDLVREVLGTTYGRAVVARFLLALVGAALIRWPNRWAISIWALAVGSTFGLAGHAAAGSLRSLALVSETVHAVAASLWLGGLVLLLAVALRSAHAVEVVGRFSRLAFGCVVAVVATGLFQSWRGVGWSWGALSSTEYGHELLFKLALVVYVLFLAGLSRAWVWRTVQSKADPDVGLLARTVGGEAFGLVVVLALTSGLVATEPAKTAYHPSTGATLLIEGDTVQVSAVPTGDRQVGLHLYLFDKAGQPTDPPEVDASVSLGAVGPLPVQLDNGGPGHRLAVIDVPVAGTWKLAVTVRTTAIDEATKTVDVPIR